MTPEALKANTYYKRRYEDALHVADVAGPTWENLTDEQREKVRRECDRYQRELNAFGLELRSEVAR